MSSGAEQKPVKKLALVRDDVRKLGIRSGMRTGAYQIGAPPSTSDDSKVGAAGGGLAPSWSHKSNQNGP